jgi:hypothetical protein
MHHVIVCALPKTHVQSLVRYTILIKTHLLFSLNCASNSLSDLSRRAKCRLMQAWAKGNNAVSHETLLGAPQGAWRAQAEESAVIHILLHRLSLYTCQVPQMHMSSANCDQICQR